MALYRRIHFNRQDIIKAFEYISENGAPNGFAIEGSDYNIVYNGLAYNVKALFKVIAGNRIGGNDSFHSTEKFRQKFKDEGFEIIKKNKGNNFLDTTSSPNFNIGKSNTVLPKKIFIKKNMRSLHEKDFKELFNAIMNSLFSDKNKEKTLEEYKNTKCREISSENGIYVAKNSENKEIEILEKPEIFLYDKPDVTKTHNKSEDGFTDKCKCINNLYLYVGKANGKNGIKDRLKKYINYGYGGHDTHCGGYHLWFVKNNKNLYVNYATIEEIKEKQSELYKQADVMQQKYSKSISEIIEMGLICLHDLVYGYAPLANSQKQSEYSSYKINGNSTGCTIYKEWEKYWEKKLSKIN